MLFLVVKKASVLNNSHRQSEEIQLMKYFNAVIEQLIQMHKDENTIYTPTKMFHSSNELSFAISRLLDAKKILIGETPDNEELTPDLHKIWCDMREDMPKDTAQNIAICIINNTPLSKTSEEISSVKHLFYNLLNDFTNNQELSNAFTKIFFSNTESQNIDKRQFQKKRP